MAANVCRLRSRLWNHGHGHARHAIYTLVTEIPVSATAANPFNSGGLNGPFTTYDISFFDPKTQLDYVADRTNASVDVFSAATNTQVESIGGFVGLRAGTPAMPLPVGPPAPGTPAPVTALSGPDGVVVVNGAAGLPNEHQLWAGDGNSTLKAFTLNNSVPPTATPTLGNPPGINTGGQFRVDEGAFDPTHNVLLFANNADTPPFGTLVNAATGAILGKLTAGVQLPAATGIEQSVWIGGTTQRFFLNVDTTGAGDVVAIDPTANGGAGGVTHVYDLGALGVASCGPTGLAVASGARLTVVCGSGPVLVLDPNANSGNGAIVAQFAQLTGGDEAWCDPTTNRCFATGLTDAAVATSRVVGVIDFDTATPSLFQLIPTSNGDHSVAVDPISGEVFVPTGGAVAGSVCPNGCILVFADIAAVPEPASLTLIMTAFVGFAGLVWSRRRRQS
jgi:hypothetical protein